MAPSVSAEESYEAQQQRLRAQSGYDEDGDPEAPDIQAPEVNPEVYKDVEPLLFRGFLTVAAAINGVSFVFKSLNHHEFEWLSLTQDFKGGGSGAVHRYHNMFLAYGVTVVDGMNVLKNRDEHLPELADFFGSLPKLGRQKVVRHLSEVNRRATRAVLLVEPFIMESQSRLRWVQLKGLDLSSPAVTGIEGSQGLGLNWGQLTWRALNHFEDLKENAEREWENAKFIASSMAGKGMQKVYSADKRRRQDAKNEQIERREKVIRFALLNEPLEDSKQHGNVVVARTVEELSNQLENDLKGEKDWHDRAIEGHENRVREDMERRARTIHEARAAHIREFGDRAVIANTSIAGLTRAEVQQRLQSRQADIAEGLAIRAKHPELTDPKYAEFSEKWLQQPIVRNAPSVMPAETRQRPRGTPFRRGS